MKILLRINNLYMMCLQNIVTVYKIYKYCEEITKKM